MATRFFRVKFYYKSHFNKLLLEKILKNYLDKYYDSLIEYKHVASRVNRVFVDDIARYTLDNAILNLGSSLVLRDWSGGSSYNGSHYCYATDSIVHTNKEGYSAFINETLSKQFCLLYAQSFEGLERFLKDLLFELQSVDSDLRVSFKSKSDQILPRKKMPSGDTLSGVIDQIFDSFSYQKNNAKFDLKTSFYILSQTRHNIIHNNYTFSKSEIFCSNEKRDLFLELFNYDEIDNQTCKIKLNIDDFKKIIDFMCGFAFQIFKKVCLKYDFDWRIYSGMDKF